MTAPRFSPDFWSQRRQESNRELLLSLDSRRRAIAEFYAPSGFVDVEDPALLELEAEGRADPLHADGPWRVVSHWAPGPGRTAQSLFIPEHYEPKYAYPLLVWLTDDEHPSDLAELMPDVSTRNCIGLTYPIPRRRNRAAALEQNAPTEAEAAGILAGLRQAVLDVRNRFHVHSERIFLAGFDASASWALDLVLRQPDWFGGAVVLGGRVASMKDALARCGGLPGKRILLGSSPAGNLATRDELAEARRLLHSAGLDVETQPYDPADGEARVLSRINRWMMDAICAPA